MENKSKVVILRGWLEDYIPKRLEELGYEVHALDYSGLPVAVDTHPKHGPILTINNQPILKNGKPAIPRTFYKLGENGQENVVLQIRAESLLNFDEIAFAVTRITMMADVPLGLSLLKLFEYHGVPLTDSLHAHRTARSKTLSAMAFQDHGIPTPESISFRAQSVNFEKAMDFYDAHKGKVVVKPDIGLRGDDITFPANKDELKHDITELAKVGKDIFLQKQIVTKGAPYHYRIFVAGGIAQNCAKQTAKDGELLTNAAKGATIEDIDLIKEHGELAVNAAKALGVNFAGIDLMEDESGSLYILEANITPDVISPIDRDYLTDCILKPVLEKSSSTTS